MTCQSINFNEPRFNGVVNVILCGTPQSAGEYDDRPTPANPQGTGARIFIVQGNMFIEPVNGNRNLFFTRFSNGQCPDTAQARLVLRFSGPQHSVSFRLQSDFAGNNGAPVLVQFFAIEAPPPGTQPVQSHAFTFTDLPATVSFSDPNQTVREVLITTRSAENSIDDLQFCDAIPAALHDVAAVFDGSGSMSVQGKWQAMIEAGDLFYDIYRALGNPADSFGGLVFRGNCGVNVGGPTVSVLTPLGPLSAPVNLPALFAADTPHGCTPIGDAMVAAGTMVTAGGNPAKAALLLTDGLNNEGRSVAAADTDAALQGVSVHAIGLGSGAQIDPVAISAMAVHHGGTFRQTTNPVEIVDFFAQALSQILGKAELAAVTGDSAVVATGTTKAVFLVAWDVGGAAVSFNLQAPDGTVFTSAAPVPSGPVSSISFQGAGGSSFHAFFTVEGADLGGTWSFVGVPASARRLVVEDLALRIQWSISPKLGLTGQPIVVRARITNNGKPYTGAAQVRALVTAPDGSTGEILALGGSLLKRVPAAADPNLRRVVAARGLKELKLKDLPEKKGEAMLFAHSGNGVYELVLSDTGLDGVYRFDLEARSQSPKTPFHRRLSLFSVLVSAPATGAGNARVVPLADGLARLEVKPLRKDKRPLGPFLGDAIALHAQQGKLLGKLKDHLDGRYSQVLAWDGKGALSVAIDVLGRRFTAGKVTVEDKRGTGAKAARKR